MKKKNLLLILIFSILSPLLLWSQEKEIYGWLRFDTRNQDEYGICKFTLENPSNITVVYPHDPASAACAGAFANNKYYVYLYDPQESGAVPLSFNYVDLATGAFNQIADYRKMTTLYSDMTYDYSTKTMFALGKNSSGSTLLKVDLNTGESSLIGQMERLYITLACSYEGDMYAIDGYEGILWKINKETGTATEVGATYEIPALYLQSMEFDHESNTLYWAANDTRDNGFLSKIDLETGESTWIDVLGNDAQVVGLHIPFNKVAPNAPASISDLKVSAGANGLLSATLNWKNPSKTYAGENLNSLSKVLIYRNEDLVHEIPNPIIGGNTSWTDTGMENGISTYRLTAINQKGESAPISASLFIGRDVPSSPTQPWVGIVDNNKIKITWATPTRGLNGGWFDHNSLTYKITRLPDQIVVAESLTENEFIDKSIISLNNYAYEIQSITSEGTGGKVITNSLVAGPSITVPYNCDFATDEVFAQWNIIDANNDNYTWKRETTLKAAEYYYNEDGATPGDDWLISSPIYLEKGKLYRLSFKLQSYDVSYPEKLGVYLGTGKSVADQTMLLGEYVAESNTFTGFKVMLPKDIESGDYHLSFHCHSEPEMFILYLTDVFLEEVSEGGLSGIVTNGTNPLENVTVFIKELGKETKTDASGNYKFEKLKTGSYTVSFSKIGFHFIEQTNIKVVLGELTTVNVSLSCLPVYSVSGKILNIDNKPVEKAKVSLNGYNHYSTLTDANGLYSFAEVYQADQYKLIVERYGLCNDTIMADVKDKNIVINNITLKDKTLLPYLVKAVINNGKATISWSEPIDNRVFRHDNGIHGGRIGTNFSTAKSVYGSIFRTAAKLTGMTWFTEKFLNSHPTVNIFVFDLDERGEPTSKILYSKMNVPNTDMQWTTYEFSSPVNAPNGYMLALSYKGHLGLGLDNGEGPEHPFMTNTNCYSEDYTAGQFTYTETHDIKRTMMIRGIGIFQGEDELPSMASEKKYSVWRLTEDKMNSPQEWELLTSNAIAERTYTDSNWEKQTQGFYCYAVKTLTNNGTLFSDAVFTQILIKDMLAQVSVKVKTNTPQNEAEGAKVTLVNSDNDPEHVYVKIINNEGKALFSNIWKGVYKARITHEGFEELISEGLEFTTQNSYETDEMILKEYIVNPFNLDIAKTGKEGERMFHWNVVDYIFDDFESHQDFAINSSGKVRWSYIDQDEKKTYGIDGVKYTNTNQPMAYIIFNPDQTDPNLARIEPGIRPYSGSKFLAAFPANPGPNNDFIISPELNFNKEFTFKFFAKSFTDNYGPERMNVGYSLSGKGMEDFIWLNQNEPIEVPVENWAEYKYTIPAGAKYVTINCVSDNVFIFMIDDIFVGIELPEGIVLDRMKQNLSFEVYLDGKKLATTKSKNHLIEELSQGRHKAGVKAIFSSITTPMVDIEFEVQENSSIVNNKWTGWRIAPNPSKEFVHISGEYDYLEIYDISGTKVAQHTYTALVSVAELEEGAYLMRIIRGEQSCTLKLMINKD